MDRLWKWYLINPLYNVIEIEKLRIKVNFDVKSKNIRNEGKSEIIAIEYIAKRLQSLYPKFLLKSLIVFETRKE